MIAVNFSSTMTVIHSAFTLCAAGHLVGQCQLGTLSVYLLSSRYTIDRCTAVSLSCFITLTIVSCFFVVPNATAGAALSRRALYLLIRRTVPTDTSLRLAPIYVGDHLVPIYARGLRATGRCNSESFTRAKWREWRVYIQRVMFAKRPWYVEIVARLWLEDATPTCSFAYTCPSIGVSYMYSRAPRLQSDAMATCCVSAQSM